LDAWIGRCRHWDQRIAATDKACDVRGDEVERAHDRAKDELEAQEKVVCTCFVFFCESDVFVFLMSNPVCVCLSSSCTKR
jgi:hypothetical protein